MSAFDNKISYNTLKKNKRLSEVIVEEKKEEDKAD